jgi:excisionase family DNA binding protein|uniref:Helix-turn-helix domain protein n=1 Tax=Myoviridae sp. ctegP15 TaxID=2825146 RepID=A0A8S5P3P1_9CAUD|nr:MAG TPA: helix-turn-helix domain protein [Myoviridae sp. ctegP15]
MYGFVTVPEFSVLMGISTDTVYRLVKKDAIPYYKVGKNIRLKVEDFRKGCGTDYEEFQILEEV